MLPRSMKWIGACATPHPQVPHQQVPVTTGWTVALHEMFNRVARQSPRLDSKFRQPKCIRARTTRWHRHPTSLLTNENCQTARQAEDTAATTDIIKTAQLFFLDSTNRHLAPPLCRCTSLSSSRVALSRCYAQAAPALAYNATPKMALGLKGQR